MFVLGSDYEAGASSSGLSPSQVTQSWHMETSTLPRALPSDSVKKIYIHIHINVLSPVSSSEVAIRQA
jgi:hypothetical protein